MNKNSHGDGSARLAARAVVQHPGVSVIRSISLESSIPIYSLDLEADGFIGDPAFRLTEGAVVGFGGGLLRNDRFRFDDPAKDWLTISRLLDGAIVLGFNSSRFDWPQLLRACHDYQLTFPVVRHFDLLPVIAALDGGGRTSLRASALSRDIPVADHLLHDPSYDALITLALAGVLHMEESQDSTPLIDVTAVHPSLADQQRQDQDLQLLCGSIWADGFRGYAALCAETGLSRARAAEILDVAVDDGIIDPSAVLAGFDLDKIRFAVGGAINTLQQGSGCDGMAAVLREVKAKLALEGLTPDDFDVAQLRAGLVFVRKDLYGH